MLYIFDMGGVVTSTAVVIPKICELLGLSKEKFFRFDRRISSTGNEFDFNGFQRIY